MIHYRDGYKYQLCEPYQCQTPIRPAVTIHADYLHLTDTGLLGVEKGYAWDGPSGPTLDPPCSLRASLVHDALYQLLRECYLGHEWRAVTDRLFHTILIEDGMWRPRAWYWYQGVRWGAGPAARPSGGRPVLVAP